MLSLEVYRQNGLLLDPKCIETSLFYDESIDVKLHSSKLCNLHLYVTVFGNLGDREKEHSIVVYDEDLPKNNEWVSTVHLRHPRSPLLNPRLEIVATARRASEDTANTNDGNSQMEFLEQFAPVSSATPNFIVPFGSDLQPTTDNHLGSVLVGAPGRSAAGTVGVDRPRNDEKSSHNNLISDNMSLAEMDSRGDVQDNGIEVVRWRAQLAQALELEIRSLRPALERDRVIAEIDLVAGSQDVRVKACEVDLEEGLAFLMGSEKLPLELKAQEKFALCYNLQLRAASQLPMVTAARKPLRLYLECEVLIHEVGAASNPKITTTWTPTVDFEGTQGPLPKTPALNVPLNSPIAPSFSNSYPLSGGGSSTTLDLIGAPRQASSGNLSLMGGVSIIITGPQFVNVGDTFEWNLKIVNRSQRNRLFNITFGSIAREPLRKDVMLTQDPLTSISTYNADVLRRRAATHYRNTGANRGIVPLRQELRVGNLAPHVCFETKLELYALNKGTHTIESARIEDLTNRDSYDVGSLLEVIVLSGDDNMY